MGGCLPAGDLRFTNNYLANPSTFFDICQNAPYVPISTPNLVMQNIAITSLSVPDVIAIVQRAGPR